MSVPDLDTALVRGMVVASLIDSVDCVSIGVLISGTLKSIFSEKRQFSKIYQRGPVESLLKTAIWDLEKLGVLISTDIDDILDSSVVFEKEVDKDEIISFTDGYLISLGPEYPVYMRDHALDVRRAVDALGYELSNTLENLLKEHLAVPASDRWVRLDHNRPEVQEVSTDLAEFQRSLERSNEAAELLGDAKEAAIAEVGALRRLWDAPVVRLAAIKQMARSVLGWVGNVAAESIIGAAALAILGKILGVIG